MAKKLFFEHITDKTNKEVDDFINNNKSALVSYWVWRECLQLILKVYDELHDSVSEYGKEVDKILKPYEGKEISEYDRSYINSKLNNICVIENQDIHKKIAILSKYRYY